MHPKVIYYDVDDPSLSSSCEAISSSWGPLSQYGWILKGARCNLFGSSLGKTSWNSLKSESSTCVHSMLIDILYIWISMSRTQ